MDKDAWLLEAVRATGFVWVTSHQTAVHDTRNCNDEVEVEKYGPGVGSTGRVHIFIPELNLAIGFCLVIVAS